MNKVLPSQIALELVPRTLDSLHQEAGNCLQFFPVISSINVPEIRKMEIKSHPASKYLLEKGIATIPHFRTIDRSLPRLLEEIGELMDLGLQKVLLISGDPPDESGFVSSAVSPLEAISGLKKKYGTRLQVFAGMDAHRQSVQAELNYCKAKLAVGADGFFTQPFFDPNQMLHWLDLLQDTEVWVGISPVSSEASRRYWETVNKIAFPSNFSTNLQNQARLGRQLLERVAQAGQKAYLMPITISAERYIRALKDCLPV